MRKFSKFGKLTFLLGALTLFLSGCSSVATAAGKVVTRKAPTGFFYGSIYKYLAVPIQHIMNGMHSAFGNINGYGWAIIVITFVVRMVLLPLMLNQSRKMTTQQEKMRVLKPQLDIVQAQTKKATTQEEKLKLNQLMMEVYQKNGTSMMPSVGCLTMLIQLPIFSGLYMAIQYSSTIANSSFFGISLGKTNILVTIIATLLYVVQAYISMIGLPDEQKKQMRTTLILSPAMTFIFCIISPAGLGLYFLVGGIIIIIQQLITTFLITPKIRRTIDKQQAEHPPVIVVTPEMFTVAETPVTEDDQAIDELDPAQKNQVRHPNGQGGRNAGHHQHRD